MSSNNHIAAFTIVELLVGITITALLVAFSLSGIRLLQSYQQQFQEANEMLWDIQQLKYLLERDALISEEMSFINQELTFNYKEKVNCRYLFQPTETIRIQGIQQDTFPLQLTMTEASWKGIYTQYGTIDEIVLSYESLGQKEILKLSKHYSAAALLKLANQ